MNGNSRMSIILIVFTFEQKTEKKGVHSLQWDKNGKTVQKNVCTVGGCTIIPHRQNQSFQKHLR